MPSVETMPSNTYTEMRSAPPVRSLNRSTTIEDGSPQHLEEEANRRTCTTIAKIFLEVKADYLIEIDSGSVYGSAFVIPQIARSTNWSPRMVTATLRCYFFLALNCFLQWMLVYELMRESQVMNKFAGMMWLCDFGGQKRGCPDADGCIGPGGTRIEPSRMYGFSQWSLQTYVRDALLAMFPEFAAAINENVDPGEYGLESQECRLLCTTLFVFAVTREFTGCIRMIQLLHHVPLANGCWVYEDEEGDVHLKIAGIPLIWKVINFMVVLFPRFLLWTFMCRTGFLFLMETAGMENTIVNATALCFILDIDELIYEAFSTDLTKHMLDMLEGFELPIDKTAKHMPVDRDPQYQTVSGALEKNGKDVIAETAIDRYCSKALVPYMVIQAVAIWCYFSWVYYSTHCFKSSDGTYVSKPMYLPKSTDFSQLSAFLPNLFPVEADEKPYWTWSHEVEN